MLYVICFSLIVIACIAIIVYGSYEEVVAYIKREQLQEQEITHRFHGRPDAIRFYRAYKKYFDGDIDEQGLKHWLEHHRK